MNQHIAVRAIVKKDEKLLLLRRANGRPSILGKYELPGGRVEYGEQPEEALTRHIKESIGASPKATQLIDALTYIDHDNRDIQYAVIVYLASLSLTEADVNLSTNYDHYIWSKTKTLHQDTLTELSQMLLNIQEIRKSDETSDRLSNDKSEDIAGKLIIYADGGSRGNPGPSAAGFVIMNSRGDLVEEGGAYLGITTNNLAEYHGVHLGLEKAKDLGATVVEFNLDSLLVVNQLNGLYVIRNRELWPIHERIRALVSGFEKVTFRHIKREFNHRADGMVNSILDEHIAEKV